MGYSAYESRYKKMRYFKSGKSGLALPAISLGLWHNFGSNASFDNMKDMLFTAFNSGITHFDLANNYGPVAGAAEDNFGRVMASSFTPYRDEMIISTKAGFSMWDGPYGDGGSRKYLLASLDQSLKRMRLEYVDIFYHHRMDKDTPLEESMMALDTAVKSGKALYAGISNYDKATTKEAMHILNDLKCPFIINQSCYSILDRHIEMDGLKPYAAKNGVGIIAFCPLAQGLLTNRYLKGIPDDSRIRTDGRFLTEDILTESNLNKVVKLNEIAAARGQTLAQMALSWVLRDGEVTSVLIGASKSAQILENIDILDKLIFTDEELKNIDIICDL